MRPILAAALVLAAAPVLAAPILAQAPAGQPGAAVKARVAAGTYQLDPAHTQVTWQVNHMGFSLLQGQFGASAGSITIDPAKPDATRVDVTFQIDQLTTTSEHLTTHLKSKDFFDAAANPTARFVSTGVRATGTGATMTGNLTLKGVTKPVTLAVTFIGAGDNPMNKKLNFGFRATGAINRSDFGIGYAVPMVSDKVDLTINAAFSAG